MSLKPSIRIPVGISARHVHLSQEHLETLFGQGYGLTKVKDLSQPGQFACEEVVDVIGPKNTIKSVRILGPVRKESQVEISGTDSFKLGVKPPVRDSGDLASSPGVILKGPAGEVSLPYGVIMALRHIHMTPADATRFGVTDKQMVTVEVEGPRALSFRQVIVRVREDFALDFHLDTDEANAAGLRNGDEVSLILD